MARPRAKAKVIMTLTAMCRLSGIQTRGISLTHMQVWPLERRPRDPTRSEGMRLRNETVYELCNGLFRKYVNDVTGYRRGIMPCDKFNSDPVWEVCNLLNQVGVHPGNRTSVEHFATGYLAWCHPPKG